jgi:predicted XRE-type DNA-binding protein
MKDRKSDIPVDAGTGNVFADLALPHPDKLSLQAELSRLIYLQIKRRGLNQTHAAAILGLKQPDVCKLMNGRHTGFSAERLFRILNALDQDIQIIVRPKPPRAHRIARMEVVAL